MTNRIQSFFVSGKGDEQPPQTPFYIPASAHPLTALEERQHLLSHHVRLVSRGLSNGLFIYGSVGGLGKSQVTMKTLLQEGVSPVVMNSHVTVLSLYTNLWHHRNGKVIWLDDCDSIFNSLPILGILRSALWGQGERIVTYNSSQLDGIPQSFEFDSRIIFCANQIPKKNNAFSAVLSRIDTFELSATNEEVLDLMRNCAKRGFEGVSSDDCLSIVDFIEKEAGTRQISLRLLEPAFQKFLYANQAGIDWRDLVRSQLQQIGEPQGAKPSSSKKHEYRCLEQVLQEFPESVKLQQARWSHLTGKSRPSFYRRLKEFRDGQGG